MRTSTSFKTTNEMQIWLAHRRATANVLTCEKSYRGCIGLGLVVDKTQEDSWISVDERMFLPASTLLWASVVDVPVWRLRVRNDGLRCVKNVSVRPSLSKYGMPVLNRYTDVREWNFNNEPSERTDSLHPAETQLFPVFNRLDRAAISCAFSHRPAWRGHVKDFQSCVPWPEKAPSSRLFWAGDAWFDRLATPEEWMPRAYLGVASASAPLVFERAMRATGNSVFPPEVIAGFVTDFGKALPYRAPFAATVQVTYEKRREVDCVVIHLTSRCVGTSAAVHHSERVEVVFPRASSVISVRSGQHVDARTVLACTKVRPQQLSPGAFSGLLPDKKWAICQKLFGNRLEKEVELWFNRQSVQLVPGFVHFPAELAAHAALFFSHGDKLVWEVSRSLPYFDASCETFIFPAIRVDHPDQSFGTLPGGIAFDFRPIHPQFRDGDPDDRRDDR
jgi:hypothetical protein